MALDPDASGAHVRRSFKMPNTPGFNSVFSMEMQPQPSPAFSMTPLRHGSDGRTSSTPTQESFQKTEPSDLRHPRLQRWGRIALCFGRIALSVILVAAGAAMVGCEAHALRTYNATNLSDQWFLPLWPQHFDLRPTITILGAGAVILGFNFFYLISACIPLCFRRYFVHNMLYLALIFLCLVASTFATGYSAHIYSTTGAGNNSNSRDTIQSWTCRWHDGASADSVTSAAGTAPVGNNGGITPPTGFGRLCWESHAAFDITVVTVFFESAALVLGGLGIWLERKM